MSDSDQPAAVYSGAWIEGSAAPYSDEDMSDATCLICDAPASVRVPVNEGEAQQHFGGIVLLCEICDRLLLSKDDAALQARVVHVGSPPNMKLVTDLIDATSQR